MATNDFYSVQEAGNDQESTLLQDPYEEEEEALSLCDLPIHSDSAEWEDFFKEDGHISIISDNKDDDDFFEFFSEDFTTSTCATAENIVFCGKFIPFKEPSHVPQKGKNFESNTKSSNSQKGVLLPWRQNSCAKAKPTSMTVTSSDASFNKGQEAKGSKSFSCDNSSVGNKVSLLRSTTKSRWFLFMFGMPRLSTEVELRDIRSRQSRKRGPATMFPAPEHEEEVKSKGRMNRNKGLWRMMRSFGLGCSSSKLANGIGKSAFV